MSTPRLTWIAALILLAACSRGRDAAAGDAPAATRQGEEKSTGDGGGDAGQPEDVIRSAVKAPRAAVGFVLLLEDSLEAEVEAPLATFCRRTGGPGFEPRLAIALIGDDQLVLLDGPAGPGMSTGYLATGSSSRWDARVVVREGDRAEIRYRGDDVWLKVGQATATQLQGTVRFTMRDADGVGVVEGKSSFNAIADPACADVRS